VLGDANLLESRAGLLGQKLAIDRLAALDETAPHQPGRLQVIHSALTDNAVPGQLNPHNAAYVVGLLEAGARACMNGAADALVTAPVQKSVINEAGFAFTGHTEFIGSLTRSAHPVMLLAGPGLKVALVTTHVPLSRVAEAITTSAVTTTIRIVDEDLRHKFGVTRPRILVLGLNPHAGENGVLGTEEIETIGPAIERLQASGLNVSGPVPADTAFNAKSLAACDVVVAMYHDQGLPVIKSRDFGEIVNVTLGLPIIRTSVDHGTALTLAGTGNASHASLGAAVALAGRLAAKPD
jgi:4-hydroxythreonine-4-phosphate dehydrogenase